MSMNDGARAPNGSRRFKKVAISLRADVLTRAKAYAEENAETFSGLIAKALNAYMDGDGHPKISRVDAVRLATLETRYEGLAAALDEVRSIVKPKTNRKQQHEEEA